MLIVCPSCASRYELDAAKLGPEGRKVRCASCKTQWHVAPVPDFPQPPSAEETQALLNAELEQAAAIAEQITAVAAEREETAAPPEAAPTPARKRAPRSRRGSSRRFAQRLRGSALPLSLTLCGLVVIGALVWQRNAVSRAAPQLAVLFESLGFPVNTRGLELTAVESGLVEDGQGRFLVVEGEVTNIARGTTPVPPIEVAVRNAAGQTLYTWTTEPPRPQLERSEQMRFRARLATPPEAGASVQVRFATPKPTGLAAAH